MIIRVRSRSFICNDVMLAIGVTAFREHSQLPFGWGTYFLLFFIFLRSARGFRRLNLFLILPMLEGVSGVSLLFKLNAFEGGTGLLGGESLGNEDV
jgi:hypothetical protein